MSPEQACGAPRDVDVRTDVYALGAITYELLGGRLPLDLHGKTSLGALRVIRDKTPERLGLVDARLRGDLETIVVKALEKDKERRYGSVAELAADLRRHLAREPILARPPTMRYYLGRFVLRHRTAVTVGTVSAALVLILSIVASVGWMNARELSQLTGTLHRHQVQALVDLLPSMPFTELDEPEAATARLADLRRRVEKRSRRRGGAHRPRRRPARDLDRGAQGARVRHGVHAPLEALKLRARLADLLPSELDRIRDLSISIVLVGDVYAESGDGIITMRCYQLALALDDALVELDPENLHYRDNRYWSYHRTWRMAERNGDVVLAEHYRGKLLPEARHLVNAAPDTTVHRIALVWALEADATRSPDGDRNVAQLVEARAVAAKTMAQPEHEREFSSMWATIQSRMVSVLTGLGRLDDAERELAAYDAFFEQTGRRKTSTFQIIVHAHRARIAAVRKTGPRSIGAVASPSIFWTPDGKRRPTVVRLCTISSRERRTSAAMRRRPRACGGCAPHRQERGRAVGGDGERRDRLCAADPRHRGARVSRRRPRPRGRGARSADECRRVAAGDGRPRARASRRRATAGRPADARVRRRPRRSAQRARADVPGLREEIQSGDGLSTLPAGRSLVEGER